MNRAGGRADGHVHGVFDQVLPAVAEVKLDVQARVTLRE
jgi:hypothetical protein